MSPVGTGGKDRERALLFKDLATLRTDARLFANVEELRWRGPTADLTAVTTRIGDPKLLARCRALEATSKE